MKMTCTAVLAATLLSLPALANLDPAATVLAPTEVVGDRTQDMWSTRWWQWAASFQGGGPVADRSGGQCAAGQDGEVFFLAGTYGAAPVNRTCHVPAGQASLFPVGELRGDAGWRQLRGFRRHRARHHQQANFPPCRVGWQARCRAAEAPPGDQGMLST
jgi:hypothetical protein